MMRAPVAKSNGKRWNRLYRGAFHARMASRQHFKHHPEKWEPVFGRDDAQADTKE
jgi:hypothetical protein